MLHGISPLLTPEVLHSLAAMGHGDTIAIVDANFPGTSMARHLHHLPGLAADAVLGAVLQLLPLDSFVPNPAFTMQQVGNAHAEPPAVKDLNAVLARHDALPAATLERFDFYERARAAFAIVQTGELRSYGNILLTKGIIVRP